MLYLIHGDNQVASRQQLTKLLEQAKQIGQLVSSLAADKLERSTLEAALLSNSLFGESKTIVIEGIFSLPKSKKKDEFIDLITAADIDIIVWEKKSLGKLDQKKLPSNCQIFEYKVTQKLWTLLDKLQPGATHQKQLLALLHESIAHESAEFVFLMLARQVRLLIQVKEHAPELKLAPFMLSKLQKQAQNFTLAQLLNLHQQLYLIDQHQKQSTSLLNLEAQLDLLVISM